MIPAWRGSGRVRFIAREWWWTLLAVASACGGDIDRSAASGGQAETTPPNILFVVLDTTRADRLSAYGAAQPTTPFMDGLAAESVLYRHAHSVAPWTLPSHLSMFTGLYPGEHGATWAAYSEPADRKIREMMRTPLGFSEPQRLLPRRLQAAGYATLAVSGNSWIHAESVFAEGFDWFCDAWREPDDFARWYDTIPDECKTRPEVDAGKAGRGLVEFKQRLFEGTVEEPFFAFFNFIDPHFPYRPPAEFQFRFGGDPAVAREFLQGGIPKLELKLLAKAFDIDFQTFVPFYDAELCYTDHVLGELLAWLRQLGLDERTMIVLTADHGEHLGEDGRFSHQLSVEEELLWVPLLIRWADRRGAGTEVTNGLVSNLDVYQTILSAAGVDPAPGFPHRSLDLGRMDQFDREALLAENYFSRAYLRQLEAVSSRFDGRVHSFVRRAVYTVDSKHSFADLTLVGSEPLAGAKPGTEPTMSADQARRWLTRYVDSLPEQSRQIVGDGEVDAEQLEALQALGYVGGDED